MNHWQVLRILSVGFGCGSIFTFSLISFQDSAHTSELASQATLVSYNATSSEKSPSLPSVGQGISSVLPDAPPGYRKVIEKHQRLVPVTLTKVKHESKQKQIEFEVRIPLREEHQKIVRYTTTRMVKELRSKIVDCHAESSDAEPALGLKNPSEKKPVDVQRSKVVNYVVCIPVVEEREKVVHYTTCKMVTEKRTRIVNYTVAKPVREIHKRMIDVEVVRYEPINRELSESTSLDPGC